MSTGANSVKTQGEIDGLLKDFKSGVSGKLNTVR